MCPCPSVNEKNILNLKFYLDFADRMGRLKRRREKMMDERTTREEHMEWCKERALEYVDAGDLPQAFASMGSDLSKHSETKDHSGIMLGAQMMFSGLLNTADEMKRFINGFN